MKLRSEYRFDEDFGNSRHTWFVIGQTGAIHLHITDKGEEPQVGDRYYGGIEIHYRQPPDYMRGDAPSQDECWILKAPCWHDGSSLQAVEHWIPLWLVAPTDHKRMFKLLEREYLERFESETEGGV